MTNRYKIMIIEDQALLNNMIKKTLEEYYDVVCTCSCAKDMMSLYKKYTPDLILTDVVTKDEIELIQDCYEVKIQYLDGQWHYAKQGLFKNFVDKYYAIKKQATGSAREQAKLFINMSYGMLNCTIFEKKVAKKGYIDWKKSVFNLFKETYAPAGLAILFGARIRN